jgi:hypothetical protein
VIPEVGAPLGANVKELSLYGCYLDTTAPLIARSRVLVKIFTPNEYFEANATVVYANRNLGLGLVFREVKPHFLIILRKWLLKTMQENPSGNQGMEENAADEKKPDVNKEENQ